MTGATLPAIRRTADGFMTITAIKDHEFQGLCRALDRLELTQDPRFADAGNRARNAGALHDVIDPITQTQTTAALQARLRAEDVPHAVVNRPERIHEDPQVLANELLVETEHPTAGRMRQPRPVGDFEATPSELRRPAPELGEHTDEILRDLDLTPAQVAALRAAGVVE
jgi:crotonobetainyl-CoA:carnitine CoA-transferase CaiB-like acyl-CoA transferase